MKNIYVNVCHYLDVALGYFAHILQDKTNSNIYFIKSLYGNISL